MANESRDLDFSAKDMPTQQMRNAYDKQPREVEISAKDLPLHCPTSEMALWCSHPRVFLPLEGSGEALCPYCGTHYKLKEGEAIKHH